MKKKFADYKTPYMILSIFLAFIFWLYVIDVEDPEQSYTFRDVSVVMSGENILQSQGLTITALSDTEVDLKITAPNSVLTQLDSNNLSVTLDVSKLSTQGEFDVTYTLVAPNHVNTSNLVLETRTPSQIIVSVDKLYSSTFPITFVNRGSVAEGYQAGESTISPEAVTLNGSIEAVSKVDRVVVILDQEDLSQRYSGELPLILLDSQGEEIVDATIESSETWAYVTLPIGLEREIPLVVNFIPGGGATEADITKVEISPQTIKVSGAEEDVLGLEEISLGSIDLSLWNDSKIFTLPIALDSSLKNDSGISEATVDISISGLETRPFDVSNIEIINSPEGFEATTSTQMRTIVVRGNEEDLAAIDPSQIRIVADLSDITASGSTTVPVKVYLDTLGNAGVTGEYTIVVNITKI
ncbi:MAG: CdaR family protein [Eubacteriales bacterium]